MVLILRAMLTAVMLALAIASPAAETPAAAAPLAPPDPLHLKADWWGYFDAAGSELDQRISALNKALLALDGSLASAQEFDGRERARALITEIVALGPRLAKARVHTATALEALPPPAQDYSLGQLRQLGLDQREVHLELEFEGDEATRQEKALKLADTQVNDAKAAYLALQPQAPERLIAGLALMRDRLAWANGVEELRLRKSRLDQLRTRDGDLKNRLDEAVRHLRVDAKDARRADLRLAKATDLADSLRREAAQVRLRDTTFGDTPRDRARARLLAQRLLDYEVRIWQADLTVADARLELSLSAFLSDASETAVKSLRDARGETQSLISRTEEQIPTWRRAAELERSAASSQLASLDGSDAVLGDLNRARVKRSDETVQSLNKLEKDVDAASMMVRASGQRLVAHGGRLEDVISRAGDSIAQGWTVLAGWSTASLFEINDTPVTMLGLIRVAVILFIAWGMARLVGGGIDRLMQRRNSMSRASLYTLQRLTTYAIITLGFVIGLSSIGIDFTKFALLVSALGVGLGFGLQAVFSNFVAGLIILFEKSLKVGDFVELESGVNGEVREINIRSTLITTNDNIDILVPNAEFVNGRVTNWTLREAFRRIRIPFGVAYGTDKELVRKAGLEAAEAVPYTLKNSPGRGPQVWLVRFGDSSLEFELVVWLTTDAVKRPATVAAAYTWEIESALGRHGIEIPFPQRDLHVRTVLGRKVWDAFDKGRDGGAPDPGSA